MPGYINTLRALGWVIIGGESGAKARPFDITWAENLIRKCRNYDVPVYTKQLGAHPHDRNGAYFNLNDRKGGDPSEWPEELRVREMPQAAEVPA